LIFFGSTLVLALLKRDGVADAAQRLAREGKWEEAIAILEDATRAAPTAERAAALGAILSQRGRYGEAADAFGEAQRLAPEDLTVLTARAMMLAQSKEEHEALHLVDAARARHPSEAALAYAAALALANMGRDVEAAEQLRQGEELERLCADEQKATGCGKALADTSREKLGGGASSPRAFPVGGDSGHAAEHRPSNEA
jgi:tetratricopeptide (TPR) repeat protein